MSHCPLKNYFSAFSYFKEAVKRDLFIFYLMYVYAVTIELTVYIPKVSNTEVRLYKPYKPKSSGCSWLCMMSLKVEILDMVVSSMPLCLRAHLLFNASVYKRKPTRRKLA